MPSQEKQLKRFGDVPDRVVIQQMQESSVKIKSSSGYYYQVWALKTGFNMKLFEWRTRSSRKWKNKSLSSIYADLHAYRYNSSTAVKIDPKT